MSEYIKIDTEFADDGQYIHLYTNLALTEAGAVEEYDSLAALEEGSPVAQALAVIDGIATLHLSGSHILITRQPDADWYALIADISAALKEFFL